MNPQHLDRSDHLNIFIINLIIIIVIIIIAIIIIVIVGVIIYVIVIITMQIIVINEGRSVIIQSLAKLKILSKEELKTSKYCKSFGIQLNLSKKMPKRGRNTQKLISVVESILDICSFSLGPMRVFYITYFVNKKIT